MSFINNFEADASEEEYKMVDNAEEIEKDNAYFYGIIFFFFYPNENQNLNLSYLKKVNLSFLKKMCRKGIELAVAAQGRAT